MGTSFDDEEALVRAATRLSRRIPVALVTMGGDGAIVTEDQACGERGSSSHRN